MNFLAPGFLVAASAAALGVVALHFIVTRRPRSVVFPTARFVPDVPVTARARSLQLADLVLLAVRVLIILFAGAALARPIFPPQRERIARVIAADVSGSVADVGETRDSVRALFRPGDAIVLFDTATRLVTTPDSVGARSRTATAGSLSAGLVGALRAGSRVRDGADSVELVVVSPATIAEQDRATTEIRAQWPGRGQRRQLPTALSHAPTHTLRSSTFSRQRARGSRYCGIASIPSARWSPMATSSSRHLNAAGASSRTRCLTHE